MADNKEPEGQKPDEKKPEEKRDNPQDEAEKKLAEKKSKHRDRIEIKNKIAVAESWRSEGNHLDAIDKFDEIQNDPRFESPGVLSEDQRHWVKAHHAEAALQYFAPYQEREDYLELAEQILLKLLGQTKDSLKALHKTWESSTGTRLERNVDVNMLPKFPWAWARLGEVYRQKGNLPAMGFEGKRLKFFRTNTNYKASEICFLVARKLRPDYAWAKAHYGAMLINARRKQEYGLNRSNAPADAIKLLNEAIKRSNYDYTWAQIHLGVAHFVKGLNDFNGSHSADVDFMLVPFYTINALKDDTPTPALLENPVQPGAIALDRSVALTYDLLDNLPTHLTRIGDDNAKKQYVRYIHDVARLGTSVVAKDPILPESGEIRATYTRLLLLYMRFFVKDEVDNIDAVTLSEEILDRFERQLPKPSSSLRPGLSLRFFDSMMALLKTCAILEVIMSDPSQNKFLKGSPEDYKTRAVKLLRELDSRLGVLKVAPEDAIKTMKDAAGQLNGFWLLSPVWVLNDMDDDRRAKTLYQFLIFEEVNAK